MGILELVLLGVGAWFAINMGASGLAPAFGATMGARLISARWAALWFGIFVIAGALLFGSHVAKTLSSGMVPDTSFDVTTTLIVLSATNVALLLANLIGIPQSTSWVTVAAIIVLGAVDRNLTTHTLTHRLLPAWILMPLAGFVIAVIAVRATYPLTGWSLHAWLTKRAPLLRVLAFASSCYVAFAIGANNVANAVGPISAAHVFEVNTGMWLLAPAFGVGAFVLRGPARMIGRDVVPIGLLTATICNIIVASLLLIASRMGLPQSLVQLNAAAVLGVALVKEGPSAMFQGRRTRRMLVVWVITPILAALLTLIGLVVVR
ncbi:MAG TPA: inorganic phosphate transporter [Kofleriaceae bacterium]|jgi:sulfate permease|nr:inorganic phosphate transporter [Kofleriaceae bacterium]